LPIVPATTTSGEPSDGTIRALRPHGRASALRQPVEVHAYADRIVIRQDGRVVGEHRRSFDRGETIYNPWHYIKKLGRFNKVGHRITGDRKNQSNSRGVGWEFVHVAIDDHSRIAFRRLCKRLGLKHVRTRPYTPKTNGKAERFIQTCLREWAYAQAYQHSRQRTEQLPYWLHRYNWHRPHAGIDDKVPISSLGLSENNLLRLHI
jgi:Integrase core domain